MKKLSALIVLLLAAGAAQAHTGAGPHIHGFMSGLTHPLSGWDHLLAMLAVGIWSAQQKQRNAWTIPLWFAGFLIAGLGIGAAGFAAIPAELGIAASLLVMGLLVAGAVRLPLAAGYALVATFAVFHGVAHGAEMPSAAQPALYGVGMLATTLTLHFTGFGAALVARNVWLWRAAGVAIGAVGVVALAA